MPSTFKTALLAIARERITDDDPSHDLGHAVRIMNLAVRIAEDEGADLGIVIPAALFHDAVNYPKNDPRANQSAEESADLAAQILRDLPGYPANKIPAVHECIRQCSFSKGIVPTRLEAMILQDADRLEATGAISIMRTFASTGQMRRPFFSTKDPFCDHRKPDAKHFALDLFFERLLKVSGQMHTRLGKKLAKKRDGILHQFLEALSEELAESSE